MFISVEAMAYSLIFTSILSQIINAWPNRKILKYGYYEQLRDMLPSIFLSAFMCICIYPIQLLNIPIFFELVLSVLIGATIYIGSAALIKMDCFLYLWGIFKPTFKKVFCRSSRG